MMLSRRLQITAVAVWALLVGLGMSWMDFHDNTPGQAQTSPARWPEKTGLSLSSNRITLLVFVHPQCPCTAATITELERLLARQQGKFSASVVAILPRSQVETWKHTSLLQAAAVLPDVTLHYDNGGIEARRFAALTSGHVLAYLPDGSLKFAGGLTAARGQEGANIGSEALDQLAATGVTARATTPVFGCELAGPSWAGGPTLP